MCFSSPAEWSEGRHRGEPCHWHCSCHHSHQRHHTHSELVAIATLPCVVGMQFTLFPPLVVKTIVIRLVPYIWLHSLVQNFAPFLHQMCKLDLLLCRWQHCHLYPYAKPEVTNHTQSIACTLQKENCSLTRPLSCELHLRNCVHASITCSTQS